MEERRITTRISGTDDNEDEHGGRIGVVGRRGGGRKKEESRKVGRRGKEARK